jgi:hypothetical protein
MAIMARDESQRAGGGKLNRSETVTVRLDPKLNYLCELAARAQRRTKSSFIEWAVAEALGSVILPEVQEHIDFDTYRDVSLKERASKLWQVDEPDRVIALALNAPALLNHEEQIIWRIVRECGLVWKGSYKKPSGEWSWSVTEDSLIHANLREHWPTFVAVARGELPTSKLPKWQKFRDDLDDDIPF